MDSEELLKDAFDELKRANHHLFVSLKYTRTCDILMNIMNRLIRAFDFAGLALIAKFKDEEKIGDIPPSIKERQEILINNIDDDENREKMYKFIDFYNFIKIIKRADYLKEEEFRRNVASLSFLEENNVFELNIDVADRFFKKTIDFVYFIKKFINPDKE